jgi:gliding motility associated protien GldN
MNKNMIFTLALVAFVLPSFAQPGGGSTLEPPLPMTYQNVRQADMMWSKRIWRIIDLREKINLPLGHPQTGTRDRMSLMDVIWAAIGEGTIIPYETDEFILPKSIEQINLSAGAGKINTTYRLPYPPYEERDTTIDVPFATETVIQYRIKEDWFFDKQRSVMEVRIIGLAPIVYAKDDRGVIREGGETKPLFWVYFPDARRVLSQAEVFNRQNDAERWSYDDFFHKRMFNSYVMKESNVYDRRVSEYAQGIKALQESDRIKQMIINVEHDMWEY